MTIDEAISTLKDILLQGNPAAPPEEDEALQLGIEALIEVRAFRHENPLTDGGLLPSETKA